MFYSTKNHHNGPQRISFKKYFFFFFFSRTTTKATNTRHNENYLSEKDRRIRKEIRSITYVLNVYKYVIQLLKPVGKLKVSLLYSFLILVLYSYIYFYSSALLYNN